jgi:hypothetical protein
MKPVARYAFHLTEVPRSKVSSPRSGAPVSSKKWCQPTPSAASRPSGSDIA